MTDAEIESLLEAVANGRTTAREAILRLRTYFLEADATEMVFETLGGSDLVTTNAAGEACYFHSRKTVAEVEAAMAR